MWPAANPELFHWLLEGLLGTGLDVVVSLAPTRPTIFDKTAELLKDKRVVVVSWAPQNVILRHAATAFFVVRVLATPYRTTLTMSRVMPVPPPAWKVSPQRFRSSLSRSPLTSPPAPPSVSAYPSA